MDLTGPARRLAAGITIASLVAGCAAGTSLSPSAPSSAPVGTAAPAADASTPTPLPSAASPSASPDVVAVTTDLAYETPDPLLKQGLLDVYAPTAAGTWPVVVWFHGSPPDNVKSTWAHGARDLAARGFVVFVPSWGHATGSPLTSPGYEELSVAVGETACAVAFAQAHAAEYGGDPAKTIVSGHSAGANIASVIAFNRPTPTAGCAGGPTLGPISALVTWDGDWMMIDPTYDAHLAADRRPLDVYTPLRNVAAHEDLPVVLLRSEIVGPYVRNLSEPTDMDAFFAARDPTGKLRPQLETLGALADGQFDLLELQEFFFAYLKANGNPVSLDVLPGTTHDSLSDEGWGVMLAAFDKAAEGG